MFFILVHLRLFAAVRHDFAKVYLKTKKMTDISQTQAGFKAKSLGTGILFHFKIQTQKHSCVN